MLQNKEREALLLLGMASDSSIHKERGVLPVVWNQKWKRPERGHLATGKYPAVSRIVTVAYVGIHLSYTEHP